MSRTILLAFMLCSSVAVADETIQAAPAGADPGTQAPASDELPLEPVATTETAPLGLSVGAKIGGSIATSPLTSAFFVGLDVGYRLPMVHQLFGVDFELGYAKPSLGESISSPAVGTVAYELTERLVSAAVLATVRMHVEDLHPYAGAGLGLYFLQSTMKSLGNTVTETQKRAAPILAGGAGLDLGPGEVFGELRYHYVGLEFQATGGSNAGGITAAAGYRMHF